MNSKTKILAKKKTPDLWNGSKRQNNEKHNAVDVSFQKPDSTILKLFST